MLNRYLGRRSLTVNDISADVIECFLRESSSTIRTRHTHANSLRQFFRYLHYRHYSRMDLSLYVLPDNCNRHSIVLTRGCGQEAGPGFAGLPSGYTEQSDASNQAVSGRVAGINKYNTGDASSSPIMTGDDSHMMLWLILMTVSSAALIGVLICRYKRK